MQTLRVSLFSQASSRWGPRPGMPDAAALQDSAFCCVVPGGIMAFCPQQPQNPKPQKTLKLKPPAPTPATLKCETQRGKLWPARRCAPSPRCPTGPFFFAFLSGVGLAGLLGPRAVLGLRVQGLGFRVSVEGVWGAETMVHMVPCRCI